MLLLGMVGHQWKTAHHLNNLSTILLEREPTTKHIDICHRFMTELINCEPPKLKVMYINTEGNPSDLGSKNVKERLHIKHNSNISNGTLLPEKMKIKHDESIGEDVVSNNAFIPVDLLLAGELERASTPGILRLDVCSSLSNDKDRVKRKEENILYGWPTL